MSIAIIANPTAGRGRGHKVAQEIDQLLQAKGIEYQMIPTKGPYEAEKLARQASGNHKIVAALGGDGTIREVLAGMWNSESTLGIIPGGTGNDHARGLGLPLNPKAALDVILSGKEATMDIGHEQDSIFGVLASIGFPVTVIENVNARRESVLKGPLAILVSVYYTLRNLQSYQVELTVDGTSYSRSIVGLLLMNMPYGGGGLKFAPQARFGDGKLTVVVVKDLSKMELAKTLPKVYRGGHANHPAVEFFQGTRISVASEKLPKMFDGDLIGTTPLRAEVIPQATKVMVV